MNANRFRLFQSPLRIRNLMCLALKEREIMKVLRL
jgi:hypothetical protein